jgi:hypothetical protein
MKISEDTIIKELVELRREISELIIKKEFRTELL